jgi:hypothetical protein
MAISPKMPIVTPIMAASVMFRVVTVLWLGILPPALLGDPGEWNLGKPPQPPSPEQVVLLGQFGPGLMDQTGSFEVDTSSREQVRLFHGTVYVASEGIDLEWTGDAASCLAGTVSVTSHEAVLRRINYFRALAGMPAGVVFDDVLNAKAQEAALMMSANDTLDHFPPPSWSCYTEDGADAARNSNLAIGRAGPFAIDGYMEDFGAGNSAVGHRRWLLYPQTETMGTGDVPRSGSLRSANAVWVFDGNFGGPRPATREAYVSWPPKGYVPYQVVYPRWSFSYPGANFSGATVSMTDAAGDVPVTLEPVGVNFGENTLVWYPSQLNPNSPYSWPRPESDTTYNVTVGNVMVSGTPQDFSYQVVVFDPGTPGSDTVLPEVTGPAEPAVGQQNPYTISGIPGAPAHQFRASRRVPFTTVDGAEDGLVRFEANVSPGYEVRVTSPRHSGSFAYHLAHPSLTPQYLTYLPALTPNANSSLEFRSELGWASANQVARVQILPGGGGVWEDIYVQPGSGGAGEGSFVLRTISLAEYAGRSIQIRFVYDGSSGSYFPGADPGVGWYLDNIAVLDVEELVDSVISAPLFDLNFAWNPPAEDDYALEARAQVFGDYHSSWGIVKPVTAVISSLPPVLRFVGSPTFAGDQVELEFEVENYQAGLTLELLRADGIEATWSVDDSATFETVTANTRFRVRTLRGTAEPGEYFRLRSN